MKNLLGRRIKNELLKKRKLFCAFVTLGYPSINATRELIRGFDAAGVDVVELGFPFSDPLADGPTIQYSSERAIARGVRIEDAFKMVSRLRREGVKVPVIFFSYLNPIMHYGFKAFTEKASASGFDGLIVPDLPPGEEKGLEAACHKNNLSQIFFIAPTTKPKRADGIAKKSEGFVYYVSLRGVTGARKSLSSDIKKHIRSLKRHSNKPFLIGFGVSNPAQARSYSKMSEGVIVGSAIMDRLRKSGGKTAPVVKYVRQMVRAVKGA